MLGIGRLPDLSTSGPPKPSSTTQFISFGNVSAMAALPVWPIISRVREAWKPSRSAPSSADPKEGRNMDTDDLEPRKAKPKLKNLDPMSVEDLAEYIEALKVEIRRVEENMQKKKAHLSAAAGLFKTS
jgi:uncharacterized small protein (DUF1192 family)